MMKPLASAMLGEHLVAPRCSPCLPLCSLHQFEKAELSVVHGSLWAVSSSSHRANSLPPISSRALRIGRTWFVRLVSRSTARTAMPSIHPEERSTSACLYLGRLAVGLHPEAMSLYVSTMMPMLLSLIWV